MGRPKGGTPYEKWINCKKELSETQLAVDNEKNTKTQRYEKNCAKLLELEKELPILEKDKFKVILSDTAISYLLEVYTTVRYQIRKEISGKYLDSGKAREKESIETLSEAHDELYKKCELPRQYNDYIEGECDILYPTVDPEIVIDAKSSWDPYTFLKHVFEKEIENDIYFWQGIGYCKLYKVIKFILAYCLVDMPDEIVEDELKRILYKFGSSKKDSDEYIIACEEFISKTKFSHLPAKPRVIQFEFNYDESKYEQLKLHIDAARDWLNIFAVKEYERETGLKWEFDGVSENKVEVKNPVEKLVAIEEIKISNEFEEEKSETNKNEESEIVISNSNIKCPQCSSENLLIRTCDEDFECNECGYDSIIDGGIELGVKSEFEDVINNAEKVLNEDLTNFTENVKESELENNRRINIELEIIKKIQSLNSISELQEYHSSLLNNKIIFNTEKYQNINQQFSNKEIKLKEIFSEKLINFSENLKTQPAKLSNQIIEEKSEVTESDVILLLICGLKSKDECIEFYTDKGSDFWTNNPNYYRELDAKKKSFNVVKPENLKPEIKQTKIAPQSHQKATLANPITESPEPGDSEKLAEIKEKYLKFIKVEDFQSIYIENRAIIDRNKTFRDEMNVVAQKLVEELTAKKRKEIEDQINNL